jgi:catechol 2,3-dioxygenase-like lactoylglutathione lyase family enzyme
MSGSPIRFGHVNLIATDWRRLAKYYQEAFGCEPTGFPRDLSGVTLERGTGVADAALSGLHLRLPGHGADGPTLEIFTYRLNDSTGPGMPNRTGFGHIAFIVEDVAAARDRALAAGGSPHGEIVTTQAGGRRVTWVYLRDPEGNLVELQSWSD